MNKIEGAAWRDGSIGRRFGRLVVKRAEKRAGKWRLLCACDCGQAAEVRVDHVRSGSTTSCGCALRENVRVINVTHGDTGAALYNRWKGIVQRCTDPKSTRWPRYGGRGIENRFDSYEAFKAWALANGFAPGLTIDRIDVDGHYEPRNCRWIAAAEQQANTTRSVRIEWRGETLHASEWARRLGCSYTTVLRRHRAGRPIDGGRAQ